MKNLVIIGDSAFAEVAFEYFTHDSEYSVVAFAVNEKYITKTSLFGLPVVPIEEIEKLYPANLCHVFVALTYGNMNRNRERLFNLLKSKGYEFASYISSKSFVWHNVIVGKNCFVFENNVIQPFVSIGDNNIIWSGNHIGHHSVIGNHTFISSHVVIAGFVNIKDYCFLGINSTIVNNVTVNTDTWIGPNVIILNNTIQKELYKPLKSIKSDIDTHQYFKLKKILTEDFM